MKLMVSIAVLGLLAACSNNKSDSDSESTLLKLPAPPTNVAMVDTAHRPSGDNSRAR